VARPRVAIVHERFTELGGSERVVEQFLAIWPEATVHTSVADRSVLPPSLRDATILTSPLQAIYRGGPGYAYLLPFLPWAFRHLDVGDVDLVVTSHHAFANWVRIPSGSRMISYTHTPARWMWDRDFRALEGGLSTRALLGAFAAGARRSDRRAAQRPDVVLANSHHVAARVSRWWGRSAEVLHPPVDVERFRPDPDLRREDFFLLAGRLVPYKRPEVAVAAARKAGVRLVVAGEGRVRKLLDTLAGPGVEMLGAVNDDTLLELYRRCTALVFPGVEDFGLVPVEAQACGTPVVALRAGGSRETVVDGVTGILYEPGGDEVRSLAAVLSGFDGSMFDADVIREHAEKFSPAAFRTGMEQAAGRVLGSSTDPAPGT